MGADGLISRFTLELAGSLEVVRDEVVPGRVVGRVGGLPVVGKEDLNDQALVDYDGEVVLGSVGRIEIPNAAGGLIKFLGGHSFTVGLRELEEDHLVDDLSLFGHVARRELRKTRAPELLDAMARGDVRQVAQAERVDHGGLDQKGFGFVFQAMPDDVDLRSHTGRLDRRNPRSFCFAIVLGRMLQATVALPFTDIEDLPVTRINQEIDVVGETVRQRSGDGFRLGEGGHVIVLWN